MKFTETPLKGSYVIEIAPFQDSRGWFVRTFCKETFAHIGHTKEWVQMNHSFTKKKGTIRGMHYQLPPFSEIKMVRCIAGVVLDVIIDIRETSPTFLQWFSVELSAQNHNMIYIPEGFAHGFQSLTDNCELLYHHTNFYAHSVEQGIRYDDNIININWGLSPTELSERDSNFATIQNDYRGIKL